MQGPHILLLLSNRVLAGLSPWTWPPRFALSSRVWKRGGVALLTLTGCLFSWLFYEGSAIFASWFLLLRCRVWSVCLSALTLFICQQDYSLLLQCCLPRSATAPIILWQTLWLSCSELLSLWSNLDNLSSCLSSGLHVLIGCQYRWQLFLPDVIPSTIVLLAWPLLLPRKKNKSFQPQSLVSLLLLFSYLRWISLLLFSLLCFW